MRVRVIVRVGVCVVPVRVSVRVCECMREWMMQKGENEKKHNSVLTVEKERILKLLEILWDKNE